MGPTPSVRKYTIFVHLSHMFYNFMKANLYSQKDNINDDFLINNEVEIPLIFENLCV